VPWSTHTYTVLPYWDDLRTEPAYTGCAGYPGGTCGIYTSVSGSAPNRIFNIEWRAVYFSNPAVQQANHELRLYEGQTRFDIIYGTVTGGNASATAGVQRDNTTFTQYFCNGSGVVPLAAGKATRCKRAHLQRQPRRRHPPPRQQLRYSYGHSHSYRDIHANSHGYGYRHTHSPATLTPTATATATPTATATGTNGDSSTYSHTHRDCLTLATFSPTLVRSRRGVRARFVERHGDLLEWGDFAYCPDQA
jgi:hypothetical protein